MGWYHAGHHRGVSVPRMGSNSDKENIADRRGHLFTSDKVHMGVRSVILSVRINKGRTSRKYQD